jgi:hypothetical protein
MQEKLIAARNDQLEDLRSVWKIDHEEIVGFDDCARARESMLCLVIFSLVPSLSIGLQATHRRRKSGGFW